jgi:hypothetical protein
MRRAQNVALVVVFLLLVFGLGYFRGQRKAPPAVPRYSLTREKVREVYSALPRALAGALEESRGSQLPPSTAGAEHPVSLGGEMRVNGIPMSISTYETDRSVEEVIAEVRAGLTGPPETIVTGIEAGQGFVSQIDPSTMRMTTVLAFAQAGGRTRVLPAVTEAGVAPKERRVEDFPLQNPTLHAFHLEATDGGRRSDTFTFQRPGRPAAEMSWVLGQMQSVGWVPDPNFRSVAHRKDPDAHNIFLTRGDREATITVRPAGDSPGSDIVVILADGIR